MNKEADARGQKHANRLSECLTSSLGNDLRNRLACVCSGGLSWKAGLLPLVQAPAQPNWELFENRQERSIWEPFRFFDSLSKNVLYRSPTGPQLRKAPFPGFDLGHQPGEGDVVWREDAAKEAFHGFGRGSVAVRATRATETQGEWIQWKPPSANRGRPAQPWSTPHACADPVFMSRSVHYVVVEPTRHVWCDVNPRGLPDDPQSNPELLWPLISVLQTHQSLEGLGALDFRWWKGSKVALTYAKPEEPKDSSKKVSADYESMKDTVLPTGQKVFFWSFVATFGEANAQARRPFFCMAVGQKTACSVRLSVENATLSRSLSMDQTTIYPGRSNRHVGAQRWSVANSCT